MEAIPKRPFWAAPLLRRKFEAKRRIAAGGIHFRRSGEDKGAPPRACPWGNDGAGVTRGLAQAGASGVKAARAVIERLSH